MKNTTGKLELKDWHKLDMEDGENSKNSKEAWEVHECMCWRRAGGENTANLNTESSEAILLVFR